jgi:excisionase family DNA binding protein
MHPTPPSPLALRPREAARVLGVSTRTLWTWTKNGHVPHVRVGSGRRKTTLYPVAELRAWLARQATRAASSAAEQAS